ncbi:MAG: membrane protein insertase YidC [Verrucomicrobiales bacterium]
MDRTSWIAVIICTGLLFAWGWKQQKDTKAYNEAQKIAAVEAARKAEEDKANNPQPAVTAVDGSPVTGSAPEAVVPVVDPNAVKVETVELSNDKLIYKFTNKGAGIATVHLKDFNLKLNEDAEKVVINGESDHPIGAFSRGANLVDENVWEISEKTDNSISFTNATPGDLAITKTYTLAGEGQEPYEINLDVTIRNDNTVPRSTGSAGTEEDPGERWYLYMGSMAPLHKGEWAMQLGFFWKERGGNFEYLNVDKFKKGWFSSGGDKPFIKEWIENADWAGVNGQFFSTMLKMDEASPQGPSSVWGSRFPVKLEGHDEDSKSKFHGIEAAFAMPIMSMNPGNVETRRFRIFTGPKQYPVLKSFGDDRQKAMNYDQIPIFGFLFGWAIRPLASVLTSALHWMHGLGMMYGVAIILITIAIRILIWPVYAKSTRTMKRMSKLTPKMTELKEKYKDNPQKMNEETMKLYRNYGVNPLGGCLPMFIQLPVFLSFYRMLWSEVDLRHEGFLWVDDLSMPDTQFEIPFPFFGFSSIPINPLPILMAFTSFLQMALTPKTGDKTQRMLFMLMPFIFLVICYNFAAGLSLYWTTQNIFSIFQTWLMNKLPEPELKKKKGGGFMSKLQEQAAAQQKAKQGGGQGAQGPGSRTKLASEKGDRHTQSKKRKKR